MNMNIKNRIVWALKRHPILYYIRFRLLSRNATKEQIRLENYNLTNSEKEIPIIFKIKNKEIFQSKSPKNDFDKLQIICEWLSTHIKGGPGLSEASDIALEKMIEGKGGVCSDIVQAFNNFCVVNNLKVREWGLTRIPFDKNFGGHSFNEVYCQEFDKWIMFDPTYGLWFKAFSNIPLSVVELYEQIRTNELVSIKFLQNVEPRTNNLNYLKNIYLKKETVPFLICNYSNSTYDNYLKKLKKNAPIFIIHFIIFCLGKSYYYRFPLDNYKKLFD